MIRQLAMVQFPYRDAEDPAVLLLKPHNMPDGISGFPDTENTITRLSFKKTALCRIVRFINIQAEFTHT